jgi:hypothetical protein
MNWESLYNLRCTIYSHKRLFSQVFVPVFSKEKGTNTANDNACRNSYTGVSCVSEYSRQKHNKGTAAKKEGQNSSRNQAHFGAKITWPNNLGSILCSALGLHFCNVFRKLLDTASEHLHLLSQRLNISFITHGFSSLSFSTFSLSFTRPNQYINQQRDYSKSHSKNPAFITISQGFRGFVIAPVITDKVLHFNANQLPIKDRYYGS